MFLLATGVHANPSLTMGDNQPVTCSDCGESHNGKCSGHTIRCPECDWSGGNVIVGAPCVKCQTPTIRRPCHQWPVKMMNVCITHGAANGRSKRASEVRQTEAEVYKLLDIEGKYDPVVDPYTALAQIAGELLRVKTVLGERVEALGSLKDQGTDKYATQLDVIMSAYERFLGHSAKLLTDMSRLDLDSKIAALTARIDEKSAEIVSTALASALTGRVEPSLMSEILTAFGDALRAQPQKALTTSRT